MYYYQLPLVRGWHAKTKLKPDNRKTFKYFGSNWWDIVLSEKFDKKYFGIEKYTIPKNLGDTTGIVFINFSNKTIKLNNGNKNKYYLEPYGKLLYNYSDNNTIETDYKDCLMNFVRCADAYFLFIGVESIINKDSKIIKTELYKNFMLACGIINPNQYFTTVGLNAYLNKIIIKGKNIDVDMNSSMMEWVEYCHDHWSLTNPTSKLGDCVNIPPLIHFIWFSKEPGKPNPLKLKFKKFIDSWIYRNPECTFYIWTDSNDINIYNDLKDRVKIKYSDEINTLINKLPKHWIPNINKLLKKHPNVGVRADTLRQIILYSLGGIYADINDMSCIMPMKKFREKFDFMCGLEPMMYVNNAFIATKPKHIVNKNFLEYISQNTNQFLYDWDPMLDTEEKDNLVVSETGPIAFSGILFGVLDSNYKKMKCSCIFPCSWIYPNYQITKEPESWLKPISIASHYDARDYLAK